MKFLTLVSLLTLLLLPNPAATWSLVHCSARSYCTYLNPHSKYCRTTKLRDTQCHSLENDHDDAKRDGARAYHVLNWGNCTNVSFYWNNDCTHQWMNYTQETLRDCQMRTYVVRSFRFDCPGGVDGGNGGERGGFPAQIVCHDGGEFTRMTCGRVEVYLLTRTVCHMKPQDQPGSSQAAMSRNHPTVTTL